MLRPVPKPNHKRSKPKRLNRNKFAKKVRQEILERDNYTCQQCGGIGEHIHHVKYRAQGGRGVFTNGLTLCNECHTLVHKNKDLSDKWESIFIERYGENFYKDEWDD